MKSARQKSHAAWYRANRERALATTALWRAANPEKNKASKRAWQKANPAQCVIHTQARRARKRGVFTLREFGDFAKICAKFNGLCAYCNASCILEEDHQIPITWGGHDAPWNIVPACRKCNATKGARFWALAT